MNENLDLPRVYVTQIPNRKDVATGALTPTININPASEYGEIIVMMPPRASFFNTVDLVIQLKEHLKCYDFERGDSLVALGDPSVIAVACGVLGKMHGKFRVLKWDKNVGRYLPSEIVI